jgi:hypothetical protein
MATHPSAPMRRRGEPIVTMGSMQMVMPVTRRGPLPYFRKLAPAALRAGPGLRRARQTRAQCQSGVPPRGSGCRGKYPPTLLPARARSMPMFKASLVTLSKRSTSGLTGPTQIVRAFVANPAVHIHADIERHDVAHA